MQWAMFCDPRAYRFKGFYFFLINFKSYVSPIPASQTGLASRPRDNGGCLYFEDYLVTARRLARLVLKFLFSSVHLFY